MFQIKRPKFVKKKSYTHIFFDICIGLVEKNTELVNDAISRGIPEK